MIMWSLYRSRCFAPCSNTYKLRHCLSFSSHADAIREQCLKNGGQIITNHDNDDSDAELLLENFNVDWTKQYRGYSNLVVQPTSTEEVSKVLNYCNNHKLSVVPQSGNTGLVGGSIPIQDEIVLSMKRMNEIIHFDAINGILTCEAGVVLHDLQEFLSEKDHISPIDLGAKGSCMIGGNVATNAGGQHYYRFGSMHANVLGLEVVLADGRKLNLMNSNRKDNTGYDLKHLFIGAEGTLGIITKVILSCPRKPNAQNVAFVGCTSYESVQKLLELAKTELAEILSAFELMDQSVLDALSQSGKSMFNLKSKSGLNYPFVLLIETQGADHNHDISKLETFLSQGMEDGYIIDGVLARDIKQANEMWGIREACNPVVGSMGYTYKYDISLPLVHFYNIVLDMKSRLHETSSLSEIMVTAWGHVIDGNLHLNVTSLNSYTKNDEILSMIEPYLFEKVIALNGSISAEHGIGQCKRKYMRLMKDRTALEAMNDIKKLLDPNGVLNPGKVL